MKRGERARVARRAVEGGLLDEILDDLQSDRISDFEARVLATTALCECVGSCGGFGISVDAILDRRALDRKMILRSRRWNLGDREVRRREMWPDERTSARQRSKR